jgi:flagellin-like protein
MKMAARKAVDPIIATLLLIAIAVAAGIIVYVYVNSLAGGLTGGGGSQVSEQLSLDSYNYKTSTTVPSLTVRDTGGSSVTIDQVFFDGIVCTTAAASSTNQCGGLTIGLATLSTTQTSAISFTAYQAGGTNPFPSGTTHTVKVLTADGGTFTFSITTGRTG